VATSAWRGCGRSALGLLFALEGPVLLERDDDPLWGLFSPREREVLGRMLQRDVNCPRTSSVGRLFDGLAALCGLYPVAGFEGQAAMALEGALDPAAGPAEPYPLPLRQEGELAELDWGPLLQGRRLCPSSRRASMRRSAPAPWPWPAGRRRAGCCSRAAASRTGP